jgi:carbamoyl-phosphate synthase large subunit
VANCEEDSANVVDLIDRGEVQLLIDTSLMADEIQSGRLLRKRAVQRRVPYCSRLSTARAIVNAIERQRHWTPTVRPLQSYIEPHPPLKLFIRQPLTQSGDESKNIVEGVLQIVDEIGRNGVPIEYLTGNTPLSDETFRENFEQSQGLPFNPVNFRHYRLSQLRRADAFLYVRTAMSESGAFEVSYNVFAEPRAPMFFAVWMHAPIKTTLLRELEEVCDVTYREFEKPEELRGDLEQFFLRIGKGATPASISPATHHIWRVASVRTNQRALRRHDLRLSVRAVEQPLALGSIRPPS